MKILLWWLRMILEVPMMVLEELVDMAESLRGWVILLSQSSILYSEGKKLHMQIEEKLSILHVILNKELDKPLEQSKYVQVSVERGSFANHERGHEKRKVNHDEGTIMKDLSSREEQEKIIQMGNVTSDDATASRHVSPCDIELMGTPQESIMGSIDCFVSDLEPIAKVGEVEIGDYMKLLDLENSSDEDYRRAMEMPLSFTLPAVGIPSAEIFDMDKSQLGDSLDKEFPNEMEILVPSHSFEVINADVSSNNRRCKASGLDSERTSKRQLMDSEVVQLSTIPSSRDRSLVSSNISPKGKRELKQASILTYRVVFSDIKDCVSISRIFTVTRKCLLSCYLDTERECTVQKILHILKGEKNLLTKEKACVLFTLLLLNFSGCFAGNFGSYWDNDFFSRSNSFATQIKAVMSDVEARSLFMDLCCMDGLLGLFEDFLLNGQLVVCTGLSSEASTESGTRMNVFLDGVNISLSYEPASNDQLLGGSAILALICTAIDRIGLICEASYNLLRSWESISGKFIPVLLEILEKPIEDHFIVALVILLGQLGRLGVGECGYKDKEVESLRCKLSNFITVDKTMNAASMAVQIAAVVSLLQLLSLDAEGVVKSDPKLQEVTSESVVYGIGKWFSLLSQEQQTLALGVFQSTKEEH